jgi:diacylglycerol O-acyltransferase
MEQLTGFDASFLYSETPTLHMHTMKVAVLDLSNLTGGYSFERVREALEQRLHLLPPFRRRLIEIPGGFSHPVWIEDPDFDLGRHLRRVRVAEPGGPRELAAEVSKVASTPLDRGRPLWEITVVEGLAGGNLGVVAKIHHAVADGAAAVWLLMNAMTTRPEPPPSPAQPWSPEPVPTRRRLLRLALVAAVRNLLLFPFAVCRGIRGQLAVRKRRRAGLAQPSLAFKTPITNFNTALTPNRIFAMASVRLSAMKEVGKLLDCSVNDVFLEICAGAIRRYLGERGELPPLPLVACIPVGTDQSTVPRLWGNRVASIYTALFLEIEDPIRRLLATRDVTEASKKDLLARGLKLQETWSQFAPPRPFSWVSNLISRFHLANHMRPPINLVTSNVRGPSEPLEVLGARLVSLHSVGPILEGIGLNITAWSYLDTVHFGLLACPENVPDLWALAGHIPEAMDELLRTVRSERASCGPRPPELPEIGAAPDPPNPQ